MKKSFKIILFLFLPVFAKAQQNPYWREPDRKQIGSLRLKAQQISNDTTRMYLCRELGLYYEEIQRDSALYYYKQQLLLAQKLKLRLWEAEAYSGMGLALTNLGNTPGSLDALLKGKTIAGNKKSENKIWHIASLTKMNNPHIARLTVLGRIYSNMGVLYIDMDNMQKLLANFFESRKIALTINDKALLSTDDMNLGEAYTYQDKLDSALIFEGEALQSANESGFKKYKGFILQLIGNIYLKKEKHGLAKKYYYESIQANQQQQSLYFLANSYILLANLFATTHKTDSSLYYSKKGLKIYQVIGSPEGKLKAYNSLSFIYKMRGDIDSAFIYQNLAVVTKDSLYNAQKYRLFQDISFNQQLKEQEIEKQRIENRNKIRTYTLLTGIFVVLIIVFFLYRNNRNRRKANELLQKQKEKIEAQKKNVEQTLTELKSTQAQLIQSEKMASLGELTAGIAHEIQNPLNFVNNFSEVNQELLSELKDEMKKGNTEEVYELTDDIIENEQKINHHGKRADGIVKGMLQHSRGNTGEKLPTDINALADEYLRLSFHGLRAKDKSFNANFKLDPDKSLPKISVVPQDIGRVLLNLINNAFYAVSEKVKEMNALASEGTSEKSQIKYEPLVIVKTKYLAPEDGQKGAIIIHVKDNGKGIPEAIKEKIFQPFFTTKPTGIGTGLGLSLSYEIITKGHHGKMKVQSVPTGPDDPAGKETGTEFIITIPIES